MTTLKDISQQVAKVAPLLGSALAGPGGAAIGALIANAFGSAEHSPEQLAQLIANPDALVKLKALELEHQSHLQRLALITAERQLHYETSDRISARHREEALAAAGVHDKTASHLAYLLTAGVLSALVATFVLQIPSNNQQLLLSIITSLSTVWMASMGYYFGVLGSRLRERQLHTLMSSKSIGTGPP